MILAEIARHGRGGLGILIILVLVALGYVIYRRLEGRSRRRRSAPLEAPAPAAPGSAPAAPRRPPVEPAAAPGAPPGGSWAVEARGVTKRFGSFVAVDGVDLYVPRGSAFVCLGPNGAGKTTLLRALLGLTRADSGDVSLLGVPVPRERSRALARVGAIVDEPRFHPHLSGRENLRILAASRGGGSVERIAPTIERVGLRDFADTVVSSYSMGMRQRLGVAACLIADPELLVLDEPMNGLDPAGMHEMRSLIRGLVDEGRTVVLSSHLLDEVERTCDAVAIVDRGRVVRQGSITELLRGANVTVSVECANVDAAVALLTATGLMAAVAERDVVRVVLPADAPRERVAEINRVLVDGGIAVFGIRTDRTSLEDWFLSVTTRIGSES